MKTSLKNLLLLTSLLVICDPRSAEATLIALWSFDDSTPTTTSGSQSGTATLTTTGTTTFVSPGTTINDPRGGAATPAMRIASGTFTLHVSGLGLSSFMVSYAGKENMGTSGAQSWAYSTDGSSFTTLGSQPSDLTAAFATRTVDFSAITALNGATDV